MQYQDDTVIKTVNGFQVGVRFGTAMQDAANPTDDGYDYLRNTVHNGSVLQDAAGVNPTAAE